MLDNKEIKNNRERYLERLKTKYPDKEYSDEDVLFGQINDDYDVYDKELEEYKGREKSLTDLFASNPRSAAFLTDWRNGEDPIIGLIRKFGDDFKTALEDPEKQEALAEANREYAERVAKEKEYEEEYQRNLLDTLAILDSMQERGTTDEDIDRAMDFLIGIMKDGLLGKFTKESIIMALKAIDHDLDVQQASHEGEVLGRNARIEEKLRKSRRGDGTANLAGKNGGGNQKGREMPELGAIDNSYNSQSIWERGGERRKKTNY